MFVLGVFLASILKVLLLRTKLGEILKVFNLFTMMLQVFAFQRARYLLTSIGDNSKQTWVYFLKNKSEDSDTFLEAIWKCLSNVCKELDTKWY